MATACKANAAGSLCGATSRRCSLLLVSLVLAFLPAVVVIGQARQCFAADVTPGGCFQSYITALYSARDLSQVEQYYCKDLRANFKALDQNGRIAKLKELKSYYIGDYKILDQKVNGQSATVVARGRAVNSSNKKLMSQTDTFDYVKEGGYWRISGAKLTGVFRL